MPRPIWKGHISFGLVNIPVTLFSAERKTGLNFHLIDSRDHARIRYERVNEDTGEEVPWDQVIRGYEYSEGNYVMLGDEDFKRVEIENSQTIEIESFVPRDEISDIFFEKPYYLVPGKKGEKGYVLLREALREAGRVGIAKVIIRTRQYLAALEPLGDGLALNLLRFQQEIQPIEQFETPKGSMKDYKISASEKGMAGKLVESMSEKWEPSKYHDEYKEMLMNWIEQKADKSQPAKRSKESKQKESPAEIVDMMDLLKQSVKMGGRGAAKKAANAKKEKPTAPKKKARAPQRAKRAAG